MVRKNKKCLSEHGRRTTAAKPVEVPREKPKVQIVERGDGRILIVGASAAALYCGVSQQAFGRVIRDHARPRVKPRTIFTIERRVREKYPELFEDSSTTVTVLEGGAK